MGQTVPFRRADDRFAPLLVIHGDILIKLDPADWISFYAMRQRLNELLRLIDTAAVHNLWWDADQLADRITAIEGN